MVQSTMVLAARNWSTSLLTSGILHSLQHLLWWLLLGEVMDHHQGWTLIGTSDCLNRSIYGQMVNDDSRLSSTVLSWRGGRARDTPFSFQRVADPGCRPHMVFLEVTQELYYLVSFFRVAYKRSPYEDGMADGNRQWNSFRRTITGSADGACMR